MERELKVTLICKCCGNQYGKFRHRCPACGTHTPASQLETFNTPRAVQAAPAKPRKAREQKPKKNECILCRRAGAKAQCPHCNERIHPGCLSLHATDCATFQVTRDQAIKTLNDEMSRA